MTITSGPERRVALDGDEGSRGSQRSWVRPDIPVSRREQTELASVPPISEDAARVLAALCVRICTQDPHKQWALGTWSWDPLDREPELERSSSGPLRSLWGAHNDWELQWHGYPFVRDVVASLTDSVIGLAGVEVSTQDDLYKIAFNDAVLEIHPWILPAGRIQSGTSR